MLKVNKPEVWMRGPLEGIHPLLQPVAHALLQAKEEVHTIMQGFKEDKLWRMPAGVASPAFHLQHLRGVLDRLFTYAKGEMLEARQLEALKKEGAEDDALRISDLIDDFNRQVDLSIEILKKTDPDTLTQFRGVGRAQLPSTVLGLYVHAAEHTMRHVGQLMVTVKFLNLEP